MKQYQEENFNISNLTGISNQNIEEHLKLYGGYVKNLNTANQTANSLAEDIPNNVFALGEMQRRVSFEFNGVRNHEIFFDILSGGSVALGTGSELYKKISETWESFEKWTDAFKQISKTRGIGWAALYYDPKTEELFNGWIDEHHIGQLNSVIPLLMIDMWEHSFVSDYQPSGKSQYIDDFFVNLNWAKIEENYNKAVK